MYSDIETLAKDRKLFQEKNFHARAEAIDFVETHIIDRIDALRETAGADEDFIALKEYAHTVKSKLEVIDARMFQRIRLQIAKGTYRDKDLINLLEEYFDGCLPVYTMPDHTGYDHLDSFLNGIFAFKNLPVETRARETEMVYYQKTPARIIFEIIKRTEFNPQDVFYDLGSGLGQVVMLVNLLTGVVSRGVEFEPAFCDYAKNCAADLNLNDAAFINIDARYADYTSGAVFFMYTPFEGNMLRDVLAKLHHDTNGRKIKVFTYGPCTAEVAKQDWLIRHAEIQNGQYTLGEFTNI